ncbi:27153_t:CDS:1, partial [Racocetra persica]
DYAYSIQNFNYLPPHQTQEGFNISNFELEMFVDINDKEVHMNGSKHFNHAQGHKPLFLWTREICRHFILAICDEKYNTIKR